MPTLSDRVSDILGQAVVASVSALVVAVIALWALVPGLRSDIDGLQRQLDTCRVDQREHSARNRAEINDLERELYALRDKGSRASGDVSMMQKQIDLFGTMAQTNRDNWHACVRTHDKLESTIGALKQNNGE